MNERIQELWSQAGGHYNSGNQHTWPQYTIDNPEKFAELVVLECDRYARSAWEHGPLLGRDLLIHFGFKELNDE